MFRKKTAIDKPVAAQTTQVKPIHRPDFFKWIILVTSLIFLLVCLYLSIIYGAVNFSLTQAYEAFTAFDGSTSHLIIRTVRLPRSLVAICAGTALAVAGTLMQGLTRNPLASPSILGINAGAVFAVVVANFFVGNISINAYAGFAFLGATITAVSIYSLGSLGRNGLTPLSLTLIGVALTTFLSSLTTGILIVSRKTLNEIRFWLAGSVAGRDLDLLLDILPYLAIGLLLAFILSKPMNLLSFGDDIAKGLGQNIVWIKLSACLSIILLAGASGAMAGPIGFIGLIIPHLARFLVGIDYRWVLPYAAILGAIILLLADIVARIIARPTEIPVGLITPLLGAPVFIYLTHRQVKR